MKRPRCVIDGRHLRLPALRQGVVAAMRPVFCRSAGRRERAAAHAPALFSSPNSRLPPLLLQKPPQPLRKPLQQPHLKLRLQPSQKLLPPLKLKPLQQPSKSIRIIWVAPSSGASQKTHRQRLARINCKCIACETPTVRSFASPPAFSRPYSLLLDYVDEPDKF